MPFYEYICTTEAPCEHCRDGFTVLEKVDQAPLCECPNCGGPVRRRISAPNLVSGTAHRLKESSIEKAGFTQYRKVEKGVYEKTAGKKGPSLLRGDD